MEFYETTLKGMKKLLSDFNEDKYAEIVESCLKKWQSDKDVQCMLSEFSDTGRFISIISSIVGIAIIALPSGILTAGYMEELKTRKDTKKRNKSIHDKKE